MIAKAGGLRLLVAWKLLDHWGLLGKAKALGLLSAVRPFIEQAQQEGIYYSAELVEAFLAISGE